MVDAERMQDSLKEVEFRQVGGMDYSTINCVKG